MHRIRRGDTIISTAGVPFQAGRPESDTVEAVSTIAPTRWKTFELARLECVDPDEGLWQEMLPESRH